MNEMTTAQEVEEHANRIAMLGMGQSVVLLRQYARLIKTHANAVAENARLKAAMDKYSEDEMLCNDTIEQPADDALGYAQHLATALWEKYGKERAPNWKPLDTVLGVLTQIDNMTAGMVRKDEQPAQGMVSVPVEPTGAMMVAGASCIPIQDANMVRRCYKAMIAARPK